MGLAGKNILVTGGLGFYGGHLVRRLLDERANVYATDIVENPKSYFFKQKLNKNVVLEICDVCDFRRIFSVITKHKIDFVFHVAAQAIVESAYYNPLEAINTNVMGTANVLEACRVFGQVEGVLFTSTDKAYGKLPSVTEMDPISGDHPYEASKASADLIARTFHKTYGLPVVVTRFGNVYGEGDLNFSRIIPGVMKSIVNSDVLEIRSNGKYVRDYVYVGDVVDASILLARNIKKAQGEAFNISSNENMTVLELTKKVGTILNKKVEYKILSTAVNEIPKQSVDFSKIKKRFSWKPKNGLGSTIPNIYEWYIKYFE